MCKKWRLLRDHKSEGVDHLIFIIYIKWLMRLSCVTLNNFLDFVGLWRLLKLQFLEAQFKTDGNILYNSGVIKVHLI